MKPQRPRWRGRSTLLLHHRTRCGACEQAVGGEAFLTAVINGLRPPAPLTARVAAPLTIGGYRVEAGTRIVVHIIAINRSAECMSTTSLPERFLGTRPQTMPGFRSAAA